MSCRRKARLPLHERGKWVGPAALLDQRLPELRHQGPDGSNPLPDEDAATGCRRDGIARAGLQSHARHEHLGRPAAHGSDEGIVVADTRPSAVAEPPKTAGIRFKSTSRPKQPPNPEK